MPAIPPLKKWTHPTSLGCDGVMKAIHVLRKPCAEPTVAANVLRHGTGAINVDGCRVAGGNTLRNSNAGTNGEGWGMGKNAQVIAHSQGRWPANVVFQHLEGCVQDGTRAVRSNGHYPASRSGGSTQYMGGHAGQTGLTERRMDGETLTKWSCAEGCPVAVLDAQGGNSTSPSMVTRGGLRGMSFGTAPQEDVPCYGDTGGASRFFKQFGGTLR